jgi:hypothetical protein
MNMRMALIGSIAVALVLVAVFSGCGPEDGPAPAESFDRADVYTFQMNGGRAQTGISRRRKILLYGIDAKLQQRRILFRERQ